MIAFIDLSTTSNLNEYKFQRNDRRRNRNESGREARKTTGYMVSEGQSREKLSFGLFSLTIYKLFIQI